MHSSVLFVLVQFERPNSRLSWLQIKDSSPRTSFRALLQIVDERCSSGPVAEYLRHDFNESMLGQLSCSRCFFRRIVSRNRTRCLFFLLQHFARPRCGCNAWSHLQMFHFTRLFPATSVKKGIFHHMFFFMNTCPFMVSSSIRLHVSQATTGAAFAKGCRRWCLFSLPMENIVWRKRR